ncbi:hypothetical protein L484_023181 [Morus notabilis]|uniref:RING-type E3 ubiquitin transferase n=1 Tax=Morus notabilis TaxID=981085 RepID=W9RYL0_9ROSA|nr:hypothetical protein L484_023181 [Morus notabilis]
MSNHNRLLGIFEANLQRSLKNNNIHISREYDNSLVMHIDDDNVVNIINDLWNDNWSVHWELLEDGDDQLPPLIEPLTLFHERLPEVTAAALRSTPAAEPSVEALKRTTYEGKISHQLDRLRASDAKRRTVVADMLSGLEIPFSIDVGENDVDNLLWNLLSPYDSSVHIDGREALHGGLNDVVARISQVAARDLAVMKIWIERRSTVPHEEFQRSMPGAADESVVKALERLTYEGVSDHDNYDDHHNHDDHHHNHDDESNVMTCLICTKEVMSGSQLIRMLCSHQFHEDCILPWLNKAN